MLATAVSLLLAIHTPPGYRVDVFARDLERPRALVVLADGTLLVSRPELNDVIALRDRDGDGRADEIRTALSSIERAHGLAMHGRTLYIAGVKKIVAAERLPDGSFSEPVDVVTDLPDGGRNPHRTIGVGPDGMLYVAIAGTCDDCTESNPEHATLLQVNPKDGRRRIYARGLRNMTGFDWHPETGELWGAESGIHRIGDGLDYVRERAALALPAPSSLVFLQGDAFSASRGRVARIRYRDGRPVAVEEFVSGIDGQLGGLAAGADGALFVSDERNGVVYRIARGDALPSSLPPSMTSGAPTPVSNMVLSKAFRVEGLRGPDSVLHDEEQDVYFVSNVDGAAAEKDGKGFISRVEPDGRVAEPKFIDALDAPKGMAIRGIELWVADIDRLRVFDRVTGAPLRTIDLAPHGAVFLHD
ncbi:MAG TPA: PQQ-dependent sugar dehydrogenase, partial [Thermoanaerobaculia bacterium]|nr:PQQ-dependent sugar dehydrogenase [Thermoanaerobaculia bacterium]